MSPDTNASIKPPINHENTSISAMLLALPVLAHAQLAAQAPTVLRDNKGIIRAIEFSEKAVASSLSDQAFME